MLTRVVVAGFTLYHSVLSPFIHELVPTRGGCRFMPSCSAYGAAAIRQYGLGTGFVFLLMRLARCHPWGGFGYDPVPRCSGRTTSR